MARAWITMTVDDSDGDDDGDDDDDGRDDDDGDWEDGDVATMIMVTDW